jgi:hypothetical protein
VELTAERRFHIEYKHPEILPAHVDRLASTLSAPDLVIRSRTWDRARLFVRRYHRARKTMHTVVVVAPSEERVRRLWIVTAYVSLDLPKGVIEWQRT